MAKMRSRPVQTTDMAQEAVVSDDQTVEGETVFMESNVFTSEEDANKFSSYIVSELVSVRDDDRKTLEENWSKWRRQRLAIPESKTRDTPWIRSANVNPPLTMQKVQTIFAKLIAAFAVKKPPVAVTALTARDRDTADALERWFKGMADNRYGLDVRRKFKQIAYDLVSLGTQVVKVPFKVDSWSFKRTDASGTQQVTMVRHQGPEIVPVRLEDFFTRPYWKDVQRAPWVGVRYRFFYHELLQLQAQGFFTDVSRILGQRLTEYDDNKTTALEQAGIDASSLGDEEPNQEFELYECNVFWDVDGDGTPEDVIAWVEPESGTILRTEFNPLSVRDIEVMTYIENPESLYGIGICQMVEGPQEVLTSLQRMRLDGTQLAMMKMFVARKGSGLGPNEEFYPFKLMLVEDPATDFRPIDFPDISQGCIYGEQIAKEDADRVTGANDYMAGFNDKILGSSATASGTTFLAGQANSILNSLLENTEQSMSSVYMLALYQCAANKDLVDLSWMSQADQVLVRSVLDLKVEDLPTKFQFTVRTTDINKTDESRKQSFMMASQLYQQYTQSAMQTLMMKANPQVAQMPEIAELLNSTYIGQTLMAAKVLEFFDVGNPDDFLPYVEHVKVQLRMMDQMKEQQTMAMKEALSGSQQSAGPDTGSALGSQGVAGGFGGGPGQGLGGQGVPGMAGAGGPGQAMSGGGPAGPGQMAI